MLSRKNSQSTPQKRALAELKKAGISIPEWALANGFSVQSVKSLLYGPAKGIRGESHRIAIALGIKDGGKAINPKGFRPAAVKAGAVGQRVGR